MEVLINTLKEMTPFIKDWGALIIAGISLLVAIISLLKSSKAQRLQNKVNELELKIKRNELDKIAKEKEDAELACVEARFVTVGKGKGRNGQYTKELWIDRRENSKSLAWSSVLLALNNIKEVGAVVDRPKALGDIRGVTYIYGMFYRFGLIDMPDKVNGKMKRAGRQM